MEAMQDMEIEGLKQEEDDCVYLDEDFFVNESYQMRTFTYGSQVLRLLCLESASTDYDLTGQLVWPGAELLNHYLEKNSDFLIGRSMIELGSGVGVTGLLCSRFCHQVVMTDHNEIVLKASIDAMVAKEANAHGLNIHEIPGSRAMVAGGSHEGVIFEYVLH